MHIHILGACGTFMGGVAAIAREAGHRVTGCDASVYPPMSDQLCALGVELINGYTVDQLALKPDLFVVGNVVSRGNPLMEAIMEARLPYTSGPQWLAEHVLAGRHVLAVAGTHGKTTTTAMLAWVLEQAGLEPGFLVGGVPKNFGISARLGRGDCFVIEADEYDTAFFDKRSKFVHYRPRTAILNNLEYDHADIFADLKAIETQFHHLVRTVPKSGRLVVNADEAALSRVIERGCWSEVTRFGSGQASWQAVGDEQSFEIKRDGLSVATVRWEQMGRHNQFNALACAAAAEHVGVPPDVSAVALGQFEGVKRRLELVGEAAGVRVYDDFAHHPTAIKTTIAGLRRKQGATAGGGRIVAVFEPRSNTMKLGAMAALLPDALADANLVFAYAAGVDWDVASALGPMGRKAVVENNLDALVTKVAASARPGDEVIVMSNGSFGGFHQKLLDALRDRPAPATLSPTPLAEGAATRHVLYLHGFRSSPKSTKARSMATAVAEARVLGHAVEFVCPALPASPREAMALIMDLTAKWNPSETVVIGSSLGGFYAARLAETRGCRAVLLNPAAYPARDLAGHIGRHKSWHGDEEFFFRPEYVHELNAIDFGRLSNPSRYFLLAAKGDEVINYREMLVRYPATQLRLLDGGDHALSDFEAYLPEVMSFAGLPVATPSDTPRRVEVARG